MADRLIRTDRVGIVVVTRDGMPHLRDALAAIATDVTALRALASVEVDVVVVDGGSTDGTAEEVERHTGFRFVGQLGTGLANARNEGVAAVRGDVLGFCDSDDVWTPGSLVRRFEHLADHPDDDAVIGSLVRRPLAGDHVPDRIVAELDRPVPGYTPGALLVRRRTLDRVGAFDESLTIGADSDWFVRAVGSAIALRVLTDVVLVKGVRGDSLSADVDTYRRELLRVARAHVARTRR